MKSKAKLSVVAQEAETPKDISALLLAEIMARDWSRVHISGDRRQPIDLPDTRKRGWRLA